MIIARDVFDDGQSQAGPADLAASSFIDPVKALEDMLFIFFADADAAVFDRDHQQVLLPADQDIHRAAFMIVLDGIADEVADQLLDMLL